MGALHAFLDRHAFPGRYLVEPSCLIQDVPPRQERGVTLTYIHTISMSGVVALDTFDEDGTKYMRDVFPDVIEPGHHLQPSWPEHAIGLFVAKSKVNADVIRSTMKLKFIVRHGTGYDNIDVDACKEKGIVVCNLPGISVGISTSLLDRQVLTLRRP